MQQFSITPHTQTQIQRFLDERGLSLQEAMDGEDTNRELAAILHAGLPTMVRKFYSLAKMETLFAEKKDVLYQSLNQRLQQAAEKARKKG